MSFRFRELLEVRINDEALERCTSLVESRNESIYEMGEGRGYLRALKDVLIWCQEIERTLNDA